MIIDHFTDYIQVATITYTNNCGINKLSLLISTPNGIVYGAPKRDFISARETASFYIKELGEEGGWKQAADEWGNSNSDEERSFYSEIMDIIKK